MGMRHVHIGRNARVYHFGMRPWAHRPVGAHERIGLYAQSVSADTASSCVWVRWPVYAAGMHMRDRYARMSAPAGLRDRYVRSAYAAGMRAWARGRYARTWPS